MIKGKKNEIKNWMFLNYKDFLDSSSCLNTTEMVQIISDKFGDNPEDGSEIDELYYDYAFEVSEKLIADNLINQ